MSSSIPSWQISTAHAQPFRGARDLAFCLKVPLDSLLVWASSEGSGETARMRRLVWTFAARIGDKYQIRLSRPNYVLHFPFVCSFVQSFIKIYIFIYSEAREKVDTLVQPICTWCALQQSQIWEMICNPWSVLVHLKFKVHLHVARIDNYISNDAFRI